MAKNTKKYTYTYTRKQMILGSCLVLALVVAAGVGMKYWCFNRYAQVADQAGTVSMRELILQAVKQFNAPAVRDPRTGDAYFPEAKLYVPNQNDGTLTYSVTFGTNNTDISVSSQAVFSRAAAGLYTAKDSKEMFARVPKLQACQRGVQVVYAPLSAEQLGNSELSQTVRLNNGKDVYLYAEKACPELSSVVDALKDLRAY